MVFTFEMTQNRRETQNKEEEKKMIEIKRKEISKYYFYSILFYWYNLNWMPSPYTYQENCTFSKKTRENDMTIKLEELRLKFNAMTII